MRTFDLVDQAECLGKAERYNQIKADAKQVFNSVDDDIKLGLCRELMIDQISVIIDRFPLETQKELVALLTDKYLRKWAEEI